MASQTSLKTSQRGGGDCNPLNPPPGSSSVLSLNIILESFSKYFVSRGVLKLIKIDVKTSVSHSPAARVPLLCFYHILTSSVMTEQTHGNMESIC